MSLAAPEKRAGGGRAPGQALGLSHELEMRCVIVLFAVGAAARLALALVNWQANDDHLSVIAILADEGRLPRLDETWQSFQPKLYHATVAALWLLFDLGQTASRVLAAQLVNTAAGIATLGCVLYALRERPLPGGARVFAFACVALNPKLIAISAQATNDAFAIAFGALGLAAGLSFLARPRPAALALLVVAAVASVLSKGNGFVVVLALTLALGAALWQCAADRRSLATALGLLVVAVLFSSVTLGPYGRQYAKSGSPFGINGPVQPFPHFFEESAARRPGVLSIASALFTFKPLALLAVPFTGGDLVVVSEHRTSHWSQIYGRAHLTRFDEWPPAWRSYSPTTFWLGRAILLLAGVPTALVMLGGVLVARRAVEAGRARRASFGADALLLLAAAGALAFSALYALSQRDYSSMKAIFVFPSIVAFAVLAAEAWGAFEHRMSAVAPALMRALQSCAALLAALYLADALLLTSGLAAAPPAGREGNLRTHLRQVVELQPENAQAHAQLAESLRLRTPLDLPKPDEARLHAERARELGFSGRLELRAP